MTNAYTYYLWKFSQADGGFSFFHADELPDAGFSSVYGISEVDANAMLQAKSYAGFRGVVHNDTLWLDCDTLEASEDTERRLQELGLAYSKYSSGNRGHHFGVPRLAQPSHQLPALDKQWCEENVPNVDLKLYSHLHLFRRPGHVHEKTRKPKMLLYSREGRGLDFSAAALRTAPARHATHEARGSIFEDQSIMNLVVPHTDGNRHKMFLILAQRLADRGEAFEFALGWAEHVNLLGEPLPPEKIAKIVEWAFYKRLNGKLAAGEEAP